LVTDDPKYEDVHALLREIREIVGNPPRVWLTPEQAAGHIGVSPASIRRYIRNGLIPVHRLPGSNLLRLDVAELDEWVRSGSLQGSTGIPKRTLRRLLK
jgi:excisionase family DNA binding protein